MEPDALPPTPFNPDGGWEEQELIAAGRQWLRTMKALGPTLTKPEDISRAKNHARRFFHKINEARDKALREDPVAYASFIQESGPLADEVRGLFE